MPSGCQPRGIARLAAVVEICQLHYEAGPVQEGTSASETAVTGGGRVGLLSAILPKPQTTNQGEEGGLGDRHSS